MHARMEGSTERLSGSSAEEFLSERGPRKTSCRSRVGSAEGQGGTHPLLQGCLPGLGRDTRERLRSPQVAWRVCSKEGKEKRQRWGCRSCRGLERHAKELELDPLDHVGPVKDSVRRIHLWWMNF